MLYTKNNLCLLDFGCLFDFNFSNFHLIYIPPNLVHKMSLKTTFFKVFKKKKGENYLIKNLIGIEF